MHLPTRFNGSVVLQYQHLVHVGLDDLEVLRPKDLTVTMLKQIKDLQHDLVANFLAGQQTGGVNGHDVLLVHLDLHCGIAAAKIVTDRRVVCYV